MVKLLKALQSLQARVPDDAARRNRWMAAVGVRGNLEKLVRILRQEAKVRWGWEAGAGLAGRGWGWRCGAALLQAGPGRGWVGVLVCKGREGGSVGCWYGAVRLSGTLTPP